MLTVNAASGFGSGGVGAVITCSLLDTGMIFGSAGTHTISSADLGAEAADRQIVFCYAGGNAFESGNLTSVTVGGAALTHIVSQGSNTAAGYRSEIWAAVIATGTSADIVVTQTSNCINTDGTWYHMTGAAVGAADTGVSNAMPPNASIDCAAGGVIIGSCQSNGGFGFTWTNLTERSDIEGGQGVDGSSAMDVFAAAQSSLSITCTPATSGSRSMCLAAWSPA